MGNQSRDQEDYTTDELENILLNRKEKSPKLVKQTRNQGYDTVIEYMDIPSYNLHNIYFMFKKNAPIMNYFNILELFRIEKITDIMQTPQIGLLNTIITANVANQYVAAIEFKSEIPEKYKDDPELKKFLEEYKKNKRIHYHTLYLNLNNMISNMYYFLNNQAIVNNSTLICREQKTTYTNYVTYNKKHLLTLYSYNKELITIQRIPKSIQGLNIIKIEPILKIRFDQQLQSIDEQEKQRIKDDLELNKQIIEHRTIRYHENVNENEKIEAQNGNNTLNNNNANHHQNGIRQNSNYRQNGYYNNYYHYNNRWGHRYNYQNPYSNYHNYGSNNRNNYAYNIRMQEVEVNHPNVNMMQQENQNENEHNNNDANNTKSNQDNNREQKREAPNVRSDLRENTDDL